jgi:hypothetical protein
VMVPWWFIHLYGTRDLTRDIRYVLFVPDRVGAWFNLIRLAPRDWLYKTAPWEMETPLSWMSIIMLSYKGR